MKLRPAPDPVAPRQAAYLTEGPDTRLVDEHADIHKLLASFGFYSAVLEREIWIPKDFLTDYASVPRLVGMYLLFGNKGKKAALIHDWLYSGGIEGVSRELADAVFKEALAVSGYSAFTIGAMYGGVRIGGERRFTAPNVPQPAHVEAVMGAGELVAA